MVPGKKYAPEDFLQIAWRRRWLIVLPFLLVTAGTIVYSTSLPSLYQSETLILVVPQQVPRNYVASTVTTQIDQRLNAISQQVLSRSALERLILEFDLYPEERKTGIMDDVVGPMRLIDIKVDISRATARDAQGGTSFRVGYNSTSPVKAKQVAERLASMFIDANLRDRELLAEGTDQFIEAELIAARTKLEEQERALEEYRRRNPWDQAEQVEHNRWVMINTQQSLEKLGYARKQDRDRLLFLEKLLADLSASASELPSVGHGNAAVPQTAAAQLAAAKNSLRALELRLTPEHPDIIKAKNVIAELARNAEQEALAAPVSADVPTAASVPVPERQRLLNTQSEIAILKSSIAELENKERELQSLLAAQQKRIEDYPARAREMHALTRDYDVIKNQYHELLRKKDSAKIAANLERRQIGEQMRIVEPALVPQRPFSPNRARLNLLGAALGLGLGVGLAALFEYRDTSLRTDEDVLAALALPVLALVPVMRTTVEKRRTRRWRLIWSVTGALTLVISAAVAGFWTLWS